MSTDAGRQQAVLATHLAMSYREWVALQQQGVTEDSDVRLDFVYAAPDETHAEALAAYFAILTDYEVRVASSRDGLLKRTTWTVSGTTKYSKVSQQILDQWVTWMVLAGFDSGCEFQGLGAEARPRITPHAHS